MLSWTSEKPKDLDLQLAVGEDCRITTNERECSGASLDTDWKNGKISTFQYSSVIFSNFQKFSVLYKTFQEEQMLEKVELKPSVLNNTKKKVQNIWHTF